MGPTSVFTVLRRVPLRAFPLRRTLAPPAPGLLAGGMLVHLRVERVLHQVLRECLQQAALAEQAHPAGP